MRSIALASFLIAIPLTSVAQKKLPGFDSPEKAFDAYLRGAVSQDFDLTLSALTPEAKAYHIGLVVVSVPYFFDKNEMEKLFREHGIPSGRGRANGKTDQQAGDKAFVEAMSKVKNPAKLVRTLAARQEKIARDLSTPGDPQPESNAGTQKELLSSVRLNKVTITADSAVATVRITASAKKVLSAMPEKVEFRRIKDRWYCHIDPR
jgi:hypothetical protein